MTLGVNSTALHDAALGESAGGTQTVSAATRAQHPLHLNAVALDAPRRLQDGTRDHRGLDVNASGLDSSRTVGQHTGAHTAGSGSHRHASPAALFNGGCGGGTTGNSNLAGDLAGSAGGLLGATTEEEAKAAGGRLHHHEAVTISSSSNNHSLDGSGGSSSGNRRHQHQPQTTQLQQITPAVGSDKAVGTAPAAEDLSAAAVEGPTTEGGASVVHAK